MSGDVHAAVVGAQRGSRHGPSMYSVSIEPSTVRRDGDDGREQLEVALSFQSRHEEPGLARVAYSIRVETDRGGLAAPPTIGPVISLDGTGRGTATPHTVATPVDGYYRVRAQAVFAGPSSGSETASLFLRVVNGAIETLSASDWYGQSEANLAFEVGGGDSQ